MTAGGKNVYPTDIEARLALPGDSEVAVFATDYVWPGGGRLGHEQLVAVVHPGAQSPDDLLAALRAENRKLSPARRLGGALVWDRPFPRTASMKLKRNELVGALRKSVERADVMRLS